jgi:ADP-ribose pyrophosphatase YjhB (NUDIX family)
MISRREMLLMAQLTENQRKAASWAKNSYCCYCGALFAREQPWPRTCARCANTSFLNPLPVAVLLLPLRTPTSIGVLTVRRGIEPRRGQLALPGGYIEVGESWQAACARELREEAQIEIDPATVSLLNVHSAPDGTLLVFGQAAMLNEAGLPSFIPTPEASERVTLWAPQPLAFPLHSKIVENFFAKHASPVL